VVRCDSYSGFGDIAAGIACFIADSGNEFDEGLPGKIRLLEMFEEANEMLNDLLQAFENDDTRLARTIFKGMTSWTR